MFQPMQHKPQPYFISRILPLLICLFVLTGTSLTVHAQISIAAVRQQINQLPTDSQKLVRYQAVYRDNDLQQADSLIQLMEEAYRLFAAHQYEFGKAEILEALGSIYSNQRMLPIAEAKLDEAMLLYQKLHLPDKVATIYNDLGVIEGRKNKYDEAIKYFFKSLHIYERSNNQLGLVKTYFKLGVAHEFSGNYQKAIAYFNRALQVLGKDTAGADFIDIHNNLGTVYARQEQYDTALRYFKKALSLSAAPKYARVHILTLNNIGNIYERKHQLVQALSCYNEALTIAEQQNMPEERVRLYINIGIVQGYSNPRQSIATLRKALQLARAVQDRMLVSDALYASVEAYKLLGDYKQALALSEERQDLNDSLFNVQKAAEIENLEVAYELKKTKAHMQELKESEEKILRQKNVTQLVALLLALSLLTVFYFFRSAHQLNKKLLASEMKLKQANHTKDRLLSIVGHDLRNPIVNIVMVLDLVGSDQLSKEEASKILSQLKEDAATTLQTLDNLLQWGATQMNGVVIQPKAFVAHELIQREIVQMQHIAERKGIELFDQLPESLRLLADPEHFRFVVRNLLHNAIKFTPVGGKVVLTASSEQPGFALVKIIDSGVGIPTEKRAHIFEQIGQSAYGTQNEKGNGIGLSLCKQFVTENGGRIWVEGNEPQAGVSFCFTLALATSSNAYL